MDDTSAADSRHVPNRGPAVFAVTVVTLVIASVFVFARLVCRYFIVKKVTCGDAIMMLAWLIAFFLSFTVALGTFSGLGKYDADIDPRDLPRLRRCEYIFSILYVTMPLPPVHHACTGRARVYNTNTDRIPH